MKSLHAKYCQTFNWHRTFLWHACFYAKHFKMYQALLLLLAPLAIQFNIGTKLLQFERLHTLFFGGSDSAREP